MCGETKADWQPLCRLDELPQNGSVRLAYAGDTHGHGLCLVRQGEQLYAYVNLCPHQHMAMDWLPGRFLDEAGEHIVCAMHGAQFRVGDGLCVAGPCQGQRLTALTLSVRDGVVGLLS